MYAARVRDPQVAVHGTCQVHLLPFVRVEGVFSSELPGKQSGGGIQLVFDVRFGRSSTVWVGLWLQESIAYR